MSDSNQVRCKACVLEAHGKAGGIHVKDCPYVSDEKAEVTREHWVAAADTLGMDDAEVAMVAEGHARLPRDSQLHSVAQALAAAELRGKRALIAEVLARCDAYKRMGHDNATQLFLAFTDAHTKYAEKSTNPPKGRRHE